MMIVVNQNKEQEWIVRRIIKLNCDFIPWNSKPSFSPASQPGGALYVCFVIFIVLLFLKSLAEVLHKLAW